MKRLFAQPFMLGVEGLPESSVQLARGRIYALGVEAPGLMGPLAINTLARTAGRGGNGVLVCADPAARLAQAKEMGWDAATALAEQRLTLLARQSEWKLGLALHGMERFLDELGSLAPAGACIVVEDADGLLAGASASELRRRLVAWRARLLARGARVVLMLQHLPPPLQSVAGELGGQARLWAEDGSLWWQALRWRGSRAKDDAGPQRLLQDERGVPFVAGEGGTADYANFLPPDEHAVIATARAVADERTIPAHWQVVPDHAAAVAAAAEAIAATVLLDGAGPYEFEPLSRAVHQLRVARGRRLKILVRERQRPFRYSQEWVLLNLGANQVVTQEASFSRLLSLIESLAGQRYTGETARDFDAALAAAEPIPDCGYLPPARFCEQVAEACRRARVLGLVNTLVRMPLLPGADHLAALLALRAKRPGDVATADGGSVYLFLFACREPDAEDTLARLFTLPLAELFEGQIRWHDGLGIERAVRELAEREERAPSPDYSAALPPPAMADGPMPPLPEIGGAVPEPYRLLPAWQPGEVQPPRPRHAKPAPLPMRGE